MNLREKIANIFQRFFSVEAAVTSARPATSTTFGATSTAPSSTPPNSVMSLNPQPLLDLIARHESESSAKVQGVASGYDVVVQQAFRVFPPTKPLTTMTVAEVLAWQAEAIRRHQQRFLTKTGYSAAGRYQIIRRTLQSLIDSDWKMTDLFDAETQDLLALQLLRRRGWDAWMAGRMSDDRFADELSKEWASLPFNTGRSYYAGDAHGNRSLVSRPEVMRVLQSIRDRHSLKVNS